MTKYWIVTYGCQMNWSDSERIAAVLEKIGCKKAPKIEGADLIVVNMCSIRQSAVDRVYGKIKDFAKLKTQNSKLKTILTGCILRKDKKEFAQKFDLILDIKNLPNWPKLLGIKNYESQKHPASAGAAGQARIKNYLKIKPKCQSKFSAFVPIMTGCNNFCSYCVVPHTRGREISRPTKEILDEVKSLVKKEYKEIWLLGQNVNSYKPKTSINFAKLLKMIQEIPGNFWVRFTSPHPKDFSDELIKIMAECEKITPYLNLPLQSGDDKTLKKMRRNYTVKDYKNLVKKIRAAFKKHRKGLEKEIALSTDVILGFPGETKKQFENTVKLFKEIKFDMAYISRYSPRPGTTAFELRDNVSLQEKKRREKILTDVLAQTALEKNKKYIGKTVDVLPARIATRSVAAGPARIRLSEAMAGGPARIRLSEAMAGEPEKEKQGFLIGKSRHYKTIKFKGNKKLVGKFIKVKITSATPWGLKGKEK